MPQHNTMRFDICLAYIQPMLDEGNFTKEDLVKTIHNAILKAVDDVVGTYDGPNRNVTDTEKESEMLHSETIYYDFS